MRPSQGPGVDRIRATTSATISAGVSVPKVSPGQYEIASGLFGHLAPRLRIVSCDAASHLKATPGAYDVLYSVFGALDFTDPRELLPVAVTALRPGGQLAFSPPPCALRRRRSRAARCRGRLCTGKDSRGEATTMNRWVLQEHVWVKVLDEAGFTGISVDILPSGGRAPRAHCW